MRTVCPECGTEVPTRAVFCPGCALALSGRTCSRCGAVLAEGARFCHACSHPASAPPPAAPPSGPVPAISLDPAECPSCGHPEPIAASGRCVLCGWSAAGAGAEGIEAPAPASSGAASGQGAEGSGAAGPATKRCPLCAEEIKAEALVCRYCHARFDQGLDRGLPAAAGGTAPPPGVGPASAIPHGTLREGIVPTGLQLFGFYAETVAIAVALTAAVVGLAGRSLLWAETPTAYARPALIFVIGAVIILITWTIGTRALVPRRAGASFSSAQRSFRRALKERYGVSQLLRRRGTTPAIVVALLLWAAMEASALYNYRSLVDTGWTIRPGMYVALAAPAVGAVAALLVLGRGRRVVRIDDDGAVFE